MKTKLSNDKINALVSMGHDGGAGAKALKELFEEAVMELDSVSNIDKKGNMGLQALARQEAVAIIRDMYWLIWPIGEKVKIVREVSGGPKAYREME